MMSAGAARGEAHRAFKIARRVDFEQADAGMLLVLGAEAAVVGAAEAGLDAKRVRNFSRQAVFGAVPPTGVGADEVFPRAVLRAALAEVNPAAALDDFRRHEREAVGAKAL